jgi:hypothetical protein
MSFVWYPPSFVARSVPYSVTMGREFDNHTSRSFFFTHGV